MYDNRIALVQLASRKYVIAPEIINTIACDIRGGILQEYEG